MVPKCNHQTVFIRSSFLSVEYFLGLWINQMRHSDPNATCIISYWSLSYTFLQAPD